MLNAIYDTPGQNKIDFPHAFTSTDVSATPKTSPLAYLTASPTTITVPQYASFIRFRPTTDINVSTEDGAVATKYRTYVANPTVWYVEPVGGLTYWYCKGTSADGTLHFVFGDMRTGIN
jgi:hypothetical protein